MKLHADARAIAAAATDQRGVFDKTDLKVLLAEPHRSALTRRIEALVHAGELLRFARGIYVREPFDLPTLSQRICPASYVSFGNALARHLVIGTTPARQVLAVKCGPARGYQGLGYDVTHVHVAPHLHFGFSAIDGVQWADAEKAVLDTLYFHLRGRRYPFDPFSDIDTSWLDPVRFASYLERYRNPKFVAFAQAALVTK